MLQGTIFGAAVCNDDVSGLRLAKAMHIDKLPANAFTLVDHGNYDAIAGRLRRKLHDLIGWDVCVRNG
ncbi:hypothetical protein Q644_07945 [Brucella intermedia 229E]|uniref:Uncharacterized protein n=1 Tax=Brucella intermedia 229E TaxID=1337887 RepID=U4V1X1_9HYPH|nr:hypothetical protein Q644_07945 [Brucella intermedia 229E]